MSLEKGSGQATMAAFLSRLLDAAPSAVKMRTLISASLQSLVLFEGGDSTEKGKKEYIYILVSSFYCIYKPFLLLRVFKKTQTRNLAVPAVNCCHLDIAPCKAAAVSLCNRSGGTTIGSCGASPPLPAQQQHVTCGDVRNNKIKH